MRGDQQVDGVNVFEIFVPVVAWITVRILLILSMILNLETQQVDYTNVFCQTPLEQTVFVELQLDLNHLTKYCYSRSWCMDCVKARLIFISF